MSKLFGAGYGTYLSGQKKFYNFGTQLGKIHQSGFPWPTDERTLCLFITFLANSVQHSTIKVYLSAVRSLHIEQGFRDPLVDCLQLHQLLRGIKRTQGDTSPSCILVADIMMVIFMHWTQAFQTIVCFRKHVPWPISVPANRSDLLETMSTR